MIYINHRFSNYETAFCKQGFLLILSLISLNTWAASPLKMQFLPQAELIGEARMTYLFWDIYHAKLYASDATWDQEKPFALELDYLRALDGEAIAERSIKEIKQQGFKDESKLSQWLTALKDILPDVDESSTIVGIKDINQHTVFLFNNEEIGRIYDPEFTKRFFDIWLGSNTSEPNLRDKLLGKF